MRESDSSRFVVEAQKITSMMPMPLSWVSGVDYMKMSSFLKPMKSIISQDFRVRRVSGSGTEP